jgi:hypothetical protein
MARKITMFELHFDGIHFGSPGDEKADAAEQAVDPADADGETSGRSRVRPALAAVGALAVVSAAGVMAARRFRGGDDDDFGFDEPDHDHDADHVEVGAVEAADGPTSN